MVRTKARERNLDWTDAKTFRLIQFYEENKFLWCVKDAEYHDEGLRTAKLQELAEKFCEPFTVNDLRCKINNLRTYYQSELAKTKKSKPTGTGSDKVYKSRWKYFHALHFLKDQFKTEEKKREIEKRHALKTELLEKAASVFDRQEDSALKEYHYAQSEKKVIIIGGGIAGLTAARYLADRSDLHVTVLESNKHRCGGRIWSYEFPEFKGIPFEMGAQWLHGGKVEGHSITKLCRENGIKTLLTDTPRGADHGGVLAFDSEGNQLSADDLMQLNQFDEAVDKVVAKFVDELIATKGREDKPIVAALEEQETTRILLNSNPVKEIAIPLLESFEGWKITGLSTLFYEGTPETRHNTRQYGVRDNDPIVGKGMAQIIKLLMEKGRKFEVVMDQKVIKIQKDQNGRTVDIFATKNGTDYATAEQYEANYVIVAVPLGVLKAGSIQFQPSLPLSHTDAIKRIGFGNTVKVILVFDGVFWPNDAGTILTGSVDPRGFPIGFVNLDKFYGVPALVAFIREF